MTNSGHLTDSRLNYTAGIRYLFLLRPPWETKQLTDAIPFLMSLSSEIIDARDSHRHEVRAYFVAFPLGCIWGGETGGLRFFIDGRLWFHHISRLSRWISRRLKLLVDHNGTAFFNRLLRFLSFELNISQFFRIRFVYRLVLFRMDGVIIAIWYRFLSWFTFAYVEWANRTSLNIHFSVLSSLYCQTVLTGWSRTLREWNRLGEGQATRGYLTASLSQVQQV